MTHPQNNPQPAEPATGPSTDAEDTLVVALARAVDRTVRRVERLDTAVAQLAADVAVLARALDAASTPPAGVRPGHRGAGVRSWLLADDPDQAVGGPGRPGGVDGRGLPALPRRDRAVVLAVAPRGRRGAVVAAPGARRRLPPRDRVVAARGGLARPPAPRRRPPHDPRDRVVRAGVAPDRPDAPGPGSPAPQLRRPTGARRPWRRRSRQVAAAWTAARATPEPDRAQLAEADRLEPAGGAGDDPAALRRARLRPAALRPRLLPGPPRPLAAPRRPAGRSARSWRRPPAASATGPATSGSRPSAARQPRTACADCGAPAVDWSYDGTDPAERTDRGRGYRYSLDPARYRPRCRSCHRRATVAQRRPRPTSPVVVDVERAARLYRAGASARGIAAPARHQPAPRSTPPCAPTASRCAHAAPAAPTPASTPSPDTGTTSHDDHHEPARDQPSATRPRTRRSQPAPEHRPQRPIKDHNDTTQPNKSDKHTSAS